MENITHALEMMGQGMLGIFVVLGAIALLVALMQRIDHSVGYADLCLCHSQSCTTSSSTVGLTCCSASVVISSSMRTALVVMPRICAQSPSSSAIFTPYCSQKKLPASSSSTSRK